jgi:phosphate-selective porin OprO/OprP
MSTAAGLALACTALLPTAVDVEAGVGKGVVVAADDGSFDVQLRARLQLRAAVTADDDADEGEDAVRPEFFVRRARVTLGGQLLHELFEWKLQLGMSQNDVEADLPIIVRDAYVTWNAPAHLAVRFGQMKVPFDRQRVTSSSSLQFADRSRMVNELNLDRDIGVVLTHNALLGDALTLQAGVFGGDGRNRPISKSGLLSVVRAQVTPFGAFDHHVEGDLERTSSPKLALAAAGAMNVATTRSRSTTGTFYDPADDVGALDYVHGVVDALFKWQGVSVLAEGLVRVALDDHNAPTPIARSAAGAMLQAGVLLTDHLELVGRGGVLVPLDATRWSGPDNDVSLTKRGTEWEGLLGSNFYFSGTHDVKLGLEAGVVAGDDERPDVVARSQFQIAF